MHFFSSFLVTVLYAVGRGLAASPNKRSTIEREGIVYKVFEHGYTGARIEYVENSGICEMTPGVGQMSGYLISQDELGREQNMWFW
jgi:carboxypeptidase D